MARTKFPFPVPAPENCGAQIRSPGAKGKLGRQSAVIKPARNTLSSSPDGISRLILGASLEAPTVASAKGKLENIVRIDAKAPFSLLPRRALRDY